jgi:hypothetical protein
VSARYARALVEAEAFRQRWGFDPGHVTARPGLLTRAECRAHKRRRRMLRWARGVKK